MQASLKLMRFAVLFAGLALAATPGAAPAQSVTVAMGHALLFSLDHGQPAHVREAPADAVPAVGEMLVAVRPMLGTTMSVTGNLPRGVRYRATLIFANGKTGEARACVLPAGRQTAFEHWPKAVAAVRLDRFRPAPASSACR